MVTFKCGCNSVRNVARAAVHLNYTTHNLVITVAEDNFLIRYNQVLLTPPTLTRGPMNTVAGPNAPTTVLPGFGAEPAPNQVVGYWTQHDNVVTFQYNIVWSIESVTIGDGPTSSLIAAPGIIRFILHGLPAPKVTPASSTVYMDTTISPSPDLSDDVYDTVGEINVENGIVYMTVRFLVRDTSGNTNIFDHKMSAGTQHIRGFGSYLVK